MPQVSEYCTPPLPRAVRRLAGLLLLALLASMPMLLQADRAMALSEKDYKALLAYPRFKQADEDLNITWKRVYRKTKGKEKKALQASQRQWVKSLRDREALLFMQAGDSREEAYTKAVIRRVNRLIVFEHNADLDEDEAGRAKPDDYFDGEELQLPVPGGFTPKPVCGKVRSMTGLPGLVNQVRLADDQDRDMGNFYYADELVDERYGSCEKILRPGAFICAEIIQESTESMGYETIGITDTLFRWIGNCNSPG